MSGMSYPTAPDGSDPVYPSWTGWDSLDPVASPENTTRPALGRCPCGRALQSVWSGCPLCKDKVALQNLLEDLTGAAIQHGLTEDQFLEAARLQYQIKRGDLALSKNQSRRAALAEMGGDPRPARHEHGSRMRGQLTARLRRLMGLPGE
jgi:hypothetical protein